MVTLTHTVGISGEATPRANYTKSDADAGDDEGDNGDVTKGIRENPRVKSQQVGCYSLQTTLRYP